MRFSWVSQPCTYTACASRSSFSFLYSPHRPFRVAARPMESMNSRSTWKTSSYSTAHWARLLSFLSTLEQSYVQLSLSETTTETDGVRSVRGFYAPDRHRRRPSPPSRRSRGKCASIALREGRERTYKPRFRRPSLLFARVVPSPFLFHSSFSFCLQ